MFCFSKHLTYTFSMKLEKELHKSIRGKHVKTREKSGGFTPHSNPPSTPLSPSFPTPHSHKTHLDLNCICLGEDMEQFRLDEPEVMPQWYPSTKSGD